MHLICIQINYVFPTNFISPNSISQVRVLPMLRYKRICLLLYWRYTSSISISAAYSALLLHDGKLHLLFTPASPQVIKLYHRIRTVTSLGDQNFSSPLESYKNTIIHSPSLTKMLLCTTSPHLFLSCLELGVTGTEEKGVTFLCSLLGTMNTLVPFPR